MRNPAEVDIYIQYDLTMDIYAYSTYVPIIPTLNTIYNEAAVDLEGVEEIGKLEEVTESIVNIGTISEPEDNKKDSIEVSVTLTGKAGYVYGID